MLSGFELYPRWVPLCCTSRLFCLICPLEIFAAEIVWYQKPFSSTATL